MRTEAVLMIKQSSLKETLGELSESLSKENILIKIVSDVEFNLMFGKTENIELSLSYTEKVSLMNIAHEKGITLDLLVNEILSDKMKELN